MPDLAPARPDADEASGATYLPFTSTLFVAARSDAAERAAHLSLRRARLRNARPGILSAPAVTRPSPPDAARRAQ